MSRFLRTIIGALLGAWIVLLINGHSRPYATLAFREVDHSPTIDQTPWILPNNKVLPLPDSVLVMSLWMEAASNDLNVSRNLPADKLQKYLKVAQLGVQSEPQNAFWLQMQAVILQALGRQKMAEDAWLRASTRPKWNDHASSRYLEVINQLERESGYKMSWPLFFLCGFSETENHQVFERFARTINDSHALEKAPDLLIRYASILNGRLIRDGARSVNLAKTGMSIIELASYPADMETNPTNHTLLLARYSLINNLRAVGLTDQAAYTHRVFQENDAWQYYLGNQNTQENLKLHTTGSVLVSTLPSALALVSIVALSMWLVGTLMLKYPVLQKILTIPYAPILGIVLAIAIYAIFKLSLAAIATAATFTFVTFAPGKERANPSQDFGPFFRFSLVILSLMIATILGAFFMGITAPVMACYPIIEIPSDYVGGSGALLGLVFNTFVLLLLVAPAWAIVRKLRTPWVFAVGLRDIGKGLFIGAALLSVLAAPMCLQIDSRLYQVGKMMLVREPLYYINR